MQPPEREGRVAHPAVAVVPVARAPGGLGQRGRKRRHQGSRGHEGQALQHERRALQVKAPGMVWVGAFAQPSAPEAGRSLDVFLGVSGTLGPFQALRPGERAVALLALLEGVARMHRVALDADPGVAVQTEGRLAVARVERMPSTLAAVLAAPVRADVGDGPLSRVSAVLEHRLADHLDLNLTLDALHRPDQDVISIEIGRRARVARGLLGVVPVADRQRVRHEQPPLGGHPGRLEHVRAGQISPARRHVEAVGPNAEPPGPPVEHRGEDAGRVEVG